MANRERRMRLMGVTGEALNAGLVWRGMAHGDTL